MARIICADCEGELSSRAKSCPKCGAPVPSALGFIESLFTLLYSLIVLAFSLAFVGVLFYNWVWPDYIFRPLHLVFMGFLFLVIWITLTNLRRRK